MSAEEFRRILIECGTEVADQFYPKNKTAAHGGEPSGRRGEFLRDLGVLGICLEKRLIDAGIIS